MAAEIIGLHSMTQIQKLSQSQHHKKKQPPPPPPHQHPQNPNSTTTNTTATSTSTSTWMWNPRESHQEDDDSWEARAFAEDTRNIMGTTWPPRSYTCTFCRREFRSAQALGGHMNVHRRDRARLHQAPPPPLPSAGGSVINNSIVSTSQYHTPTFINVVPPQELVANAGLCFLYHLASPNNSACTFHSSTLNATGESPSTLLSISSSSSPHQPPSNNYLMMQSYQSAAAATVGINGVSSSSSSHCCNNSSKVAMEEPVTSSVNNNGLHLEELDLELRLGHKPTQT